MTYIWSIILWVHVTLFIILFLIAAFGRRLGLRKRYIELLLKIFQFSQQRVDKKRKLRLPSVSLDDSELFEENQKLSFSQPVYLGVTKEEESGFHMEDILEYVTAGVSAIVDDAVLTNFMPEEPPCWNLLSRTNTRAYEFISFRLTMMWMFGFLIRYLFLLPTRLLVLVIGMAFLLVCTVLVGALPDGPLKRRFNARLNMYCFDFVAGSLSLFATFHNPENRPQSGITVANHTSPIDSMILSTDNVYDMVGQIHGGLLGYFMTLLSRSSTHIWFERGNSRERSDVARRLKEHTANPDLPPILIFPEGVCVNNTSVVQFKKGAFEIDSVIYPVAIRFDPRFGDAYWWQDAFFSYVLYMMTSWAIVCDVWYLPPVTRQPGETAISFANRVKATIALKGGLSDVSIDGFLKVNPPKAELKKKYQLEFAKHCSTPRKRQLLPQHKDPLEDDSNMMDDKIDLNQRFDDNGLVQPQKLYFEENSNSDEKKSLAEDHDEGSMEIRQRFVGSAESEVDATAVSGLRYAVTKEVSDTQTKLFAADLQLPHDETNLHLGTSDIHLEEVDNNPTRSSFVMTSALGELCDDVHKQLDKPLGDPSETSPPTECTAAVKLCPVAVDLAQLASDARTDAARTAAPSDTPALLSEETEGDEDGRRKVQASDERLDPGTHDSGGVPAALPVLEPTC